MTFDELDEELETSPELEAYAEDVDIDALLDDDLTTSEDKDETSDEDEYDFDDPYWKDLLGVINQEIRKTGYRTNDIEELE